MLAVAAALLATPFVLAARRMDDARRPSPERTALIKRSNCDQLREQFDDNRREFGSDLTMDISGKLAEIEHLILRRSEKLGCRPPIGSPE
jgi:hypothetical protein